MKSTFSFALSFLSLLIGGVTAAPATSRLRGIPTNLFVNFEFVAQYAAAAYCSNNRDSPHTKVTCPKGNCPLVEAANAFTVDEFEKTFLADTSGFVAVDHTNRIIVLSFRGTQSLKNAFANLSVSRTPYNLCNGCEVHQGFQGAWMEIRPRVLGAINDASRQFPSYHIIVTGHSLGGALADLAAAELRNTGHMAALYTFGAPRVGNAAFAQFLSRQPGGNFRITNSNDPFSNMPPPDMGYSHMAPEFYIARDTRRVHPADINVLLAPDDPAGNTGNKGFDVGPHYRYFGEITACGSGFSL